MALKKILVWGILAGAATALADQPPIGVEVKNTNCQSGPKMVNGSPDTLATRLDSGFVSLFNGKDLTGWWENCNVHTGDKVKGGIWIADSTQGIIYSQEDGQNGDLLVTNQTYDNYEFILDLWPTYGNDGGIFNRVTTTGKTWQTTIDYISGSGVGGSFNEAGWTSGDLNDDPFRFSGAGPSAPDIPAGTANWTNFTKNLNPTSFGCSAGGCVGSDFPKIFDVNGWNQLRIKFYDGLTAGRSVTMETWLRKAGAPVWVPVYKRTMAVVTPKNYIAIQIHGGGRWKAGSWNLYRNIKIRPLNLDGTPILPTTGIGAGRGDGSPFAAPEVKIENGALSARLASDYDIRITDVKGHVLKAFHAPSGASVHALPGGFRGVLIAELKNHRGVLNVRLSRI